MFYIKEIYLRLIYTFVLFFCMFFIFYKYKDIVLVVFLIPSNLAGYNLIEHFIYTKPTELIHALLNLNLFCVIIFMIPYIFWIILDFMKTGLFFHEYKLIQTYSRFFGTTIILLNIILFIIFFPIIFKFFESFNSLALNNISVKFELRIYEYVCFVYNIFIVINTGLLFLSLLFILIKINGINFYINHKKIFIVFNIIAATILSTPDISSQLILFFILSCFLEIFQFILSYQTKLVRHHIK